MGNPQHLKPILKELIKVYKNKKIYKFLHIPIQSGDNQVLKDMNRYYKIEDVYEIVNEFRKQIPEITISTDVIVGYPTEDEKSFKNTIKAIKKIKPTVVNISRFGKRKGIEANKFKDLKGETKKKRSREITEISKEIAKKENKNHLNKTKEILINEKGKNYTLVGRTKEYIPVVIKNNKEIKEIKLGDKIQTRIIDYKTHYLIGKKIKEK